MLLFQKILWFEMCAIFGGTPHWFGEQYRKIHIEKQDFTVIPKDIHKKNYLCLLQPQRSKHLPAATVGFISPPSAAVNTTVNPNMFLQINV